MFKVNYQAPKFGFVGWEVFTAKDSTVMFDCIKIAVAQMSKAIDEQVYATILEF